MDFFRSERLTEFSFAHRLLFQGLWLLADREGRLEDRPRRIHADVFPFDPELKVDTMLDDLADAEEPFIVRYEVDGRRYIQVVNFAKHQRPNSREAESEIPAPSSCTRTRVKVQEEGKGREGKGKGNGDSSAPSRDDAKPADDSPTVLEFPTVGKGGQVWRLTQRQIDDWSALFPALDVLAEARAALAWCVANPGRRKTTGGMPTFLVGWLNRSQDKGRGQVRSQPQRHVSQPMPEYQDEWFDECQRLHDGKCGGQYKHSLRMEKAS